MRDTILSQREKKITLFVFAGWQNGPGKLGMISLTFTLFYENRYAGRDAGKPTSYIHPEKTPPPVAIFSKLILRHDHTQSLALLMFILSSFVVSDFVLSNRKTPLKLVNFCNNENDCKLHKSTSKSKHNCRVLFGNPSLGPNCYVS